MLSTRFWGLAFVGAAAALGTACFAAGEDVGESAPQVTSSRPTVLGAVVAIEGGCTATKVGPKHLLVAARCVTNKPAFAIGKSLTFRKANLDDKTQDEAPTDADAGTDATTDASDAGDAGADADADATVDATDELQDGGADAEADTTPNASTGDATEAFVDTIAEIKIHPSFLKKCGTGVCARGGAGGADVADVAIIVLSKDIAGIPAAPIDLEPSPAAASVLAVSNGCDEAALAAPRLRTKPAKLAPADAVQHEGSPFTAESATALAQSYVVTTTEPGLLGICSDRDLGAPLFDADGTAIVGVASNVTVAGPTATLPSTNHFARVDGFARHQVGGWLKEAGATTVRSCSGDECKPFPQANAPTPDAGEDAASAPAEKFSPPEEDEAAAESESESESELPAEEPSSPAKKKRATTQPGCSSTGSAGSSSGFGFIALAVAAALLTARARRRRSDSRP
ncbi:MAG: hypothetical protein KIT84_38625 [Labilithrix sp.]|nr:hypothetical protein [Labilithrix sp.]MCW5816976.1 hypothetical protein [Labilithrix sp.]